MPFAPDEWTSLAPCFTRSDVFLRNKGRQESKELPRILDMCMLLLNVSWPLKELLLKKAKGGCCENG